MSIIEELLIELGLGLGAAAAIASVIRFFVALIIIYVIGTAVLIPLVERALESRSLDRHAQVPLLKVTWFIVAFAAFAFAFGFAGFGNILLSLTAIAAAATLAIGFAMQDVLRNFIAGIFIFTERPFRIGDWIEWDDHTGIVEDISLRITRVRTFDNELLTVPNATLTGSVVKNPVDTDRLRLRFVFGIGYDDDIDLATRLILEAAEDHEGIMTEPGPSVRLTELADSSVGLQARIWIENPSRADFMKTRAEFITDVKRRFDANGIDIPYPKRDLVGGVELGGEIRTSAP